MLATLLSVSYGNWSTFSNVAFTLKEMNSSDCQINDVEKAKNVGGICKIPDAFVQMVYQAKFVVHLKENDFLRLSKTVVDDTMDLLELLYRQPMDSKTNFMVNKLRDRQMLKLIGDYKNNSMIPFLVHAFIRCMGEKYRENVTSIDSLYKALTKPEIRLLINRYGTGAFNDTALRALIWNTFQEKQQFLSTDAVETLRPIFKYVIDVVLDSKTGNTCDRTSHLSGSHDVRHRLQRAGTEISHVEERYQCVRYSAVIGHWAYFSLFKGSYRSKLSVATRWTECFIGLPSTHLSSLNTNRPNKIIKRLRRLSATKELTIIHATWRLNPRCLRCYLLAFGSFTGLYFSVKLESSASLTDIAIMLNFVKSVIHGPRTLATVREVLEATDPRNLHVTLVSQEESATVFRGEAGENRGEARRRNGVAAKCPAAKCPDSSFQITLIMSTKF
ncbi:hypothetical protein L596_021477 [Steinernema carpocapsae]|uniref:Uncharacterized protein n=1 Tax=Steinernema carpocapsae TaxID=34508 RepID=A0A4U5MIY1_STECR|nr:hypothetical protein L596_021477 [Steinernema carpocapsae]